MRSKTLTLVSPMSSGWLPQTTRVKGCHRRGGRSGFLMRRVMSVLLEEVNIFKISEKLYVFRNENSIWFNFYLKLRRATYFLTFFQKFCLNKLQSLSHYISSFTSKALIFSWYICLEHPILLSMNRTLMTPVGSTLTLPCQIDSTELSVKRKWLKDGKDVFFGHYQEHQEQMVLANVIQQDQGNYSCLVWSIRGESVVSYHVVIIGKIYKCNVNKTSKYVL